MVNGDLVFERTLHGLRNTVLLPAGWDVTALSRSRGRSAPTRARLRRADQPQRREQLQGGDSSGAELESKQSELGATR